jgi:hypothetical protein
VENHSTEHIGSPKRRVYLCVKILIVAIVIFILLLAAEVISFYINVNSGGLDASSSIIFNFCLFISGAFFLLLIILVPTCLIASLIKIDNPVNIILTAITIIILVSIPKDKDNSYLWNKIKHSPGPDLTRGLGINLGKGRKLKEFGLKLNQLKTDKDFIFTEQLLEPNFSRSIMDIPKGKFVLYSNLLNKKPSQLSDNVVVIFKSNVPHDNGYIGGPNDISTWWHYGRGSLMVFGDSRVEFVKTEDFNNLRWKP